MHPVRSRPETGPKISIVVPARNEARNLEVVLPTLPADAEIIVVDGHSVDDTADVVAKHRPDAKFVQQTRRGKGNALTVGFAQATGDIIVMFDADGSADPAEIDRYVAALTAGADFAKGSRVMPGGGSTDITHLRHLGNLALTLVTNIAFRTRYTDLCYGYNAFWVDVLPVLDLPRPNPVSDEMHWGDGFEIETVINCRVAAAKLAVAEVPSVELDRLFGDSNLNAARDGLRVLKTIATEWWRARRRARPAVAPVSDTAGASVPAGAAVSGTAVSSGGLSGAGVSGSVGPGSSLAAGSRAAGPHIMVVGSGWRFTSGISYYTCRLSNALAEVTPTSALLVRQLVPTRLYPGRSRVGQPVNALSYAPSVRIFDGLDWFWGKSMRDAQGFIRDNGPDVLVLQWWTGAVLHSYLRLAALVKRAGGTVILEWHEVQDTGEARIPGVARYVTKAMKTLLRHVDGHVVHSQYDLDLLRRTYELPDERVAIAPHGPYNHYQSAPAEIGARGPAAVVVDPVAHIPVLSDTGATTVGADDRHADGDFTFLYFGVIRPYKGVEDLVAAFDLLPAEIRDRSRLRIVGETWEGWTGPLEAAAASPNRSRIDVVNRYVHDSEVSDHFAAADGVVLPYRRSSSSGPLHIAMSCGLPIAVSEVGGLVEAAGSYAGVTFVPPSNPQALADAMVGMVGAQGLRYDDPHSWERTVTSYGELLGRVGAHTWSGNDRQLQAAGRQRAVASSALAG